MMTEAHYDEEVLIALLEEDEERLDRDPHIAACKLCSKTLASVREIADCLKSPDMWDSTEISAEPNANVLSFLERAQYDLRTEDAAAEPWVRTLLALPREAWQPTLHAHPEWRTVGMVRKLIDASYRAIEIAPPEALEITALAVDIAESLPSVRYGASTVARHRGHAWRERAYALYFTGSYKEAVWAVGLSRTAFAECGYSEFDDARSAVVFALICAEQEKFTQGLAAAHAGADVFAKYESQAKVVAARRTEAIILYLLRRFNDALATYRTLAAETTNAAELAALSQNIALCYRELGDFESAGRHFARAMELFSRTGHLSAIAKSRWHFGRVLLTQGRYRQALDVLRQVRDEFAALKMAHDVAEVTTDIAHALVVDGCMRDVVDECHHALEYFTSAGLATTEPAMCAIGFLREAAAEGHLDERTVVEVRASFLSSRAPSLRLYVD